MDQSTHHTETNDAQKALIQRATEVFMRLGIRSVNMADLATELSISKKTLYKFVTDKRDLILQCMDSHCTEMEEVIAGAKQDSENAIDAELKLIRFISISFYIAAIFVAYHLYKQLFRRNNHHSKLPPLTKHNNKKHHKPIKKKECFISLKECIGDHFDCTLIRL